MSRLFVCFFQTRKILSLNIRSFLGLGLHNFISQNIRNFLKVDSFCFSSSESYFLKYWARKLHFQEYKKVRKVAVFVKRSIVNVWLCSEYISDSEFTRVLNMLLVLSMSGFWIYLSRNIRKFHFLKQKELFRGFRFLKYLKFSRDELKGSVSRNIRSFFSVSVSWNLLTLELKSPISRNIRNFLGGFPLLEIF